MGMLRSGIMNKGSRPRRVTLRRCLVAGIALAALVVALRVPLLRLVAHGVMVPSYDGGVDHVLVLDGDSRYDDAAARILDGRARDIHLVVARTSPLVERGILPRREDLGTRLLVRAGVAPERIHRMERLWPELGALLDAHPEETWLLITTQFAGRELRRTARRRLGARAERLRYLPVADAHYSDRDWWRDREGIKELATAYLSLGWDLFHGPPPQPIRAWDPDAWLAAYRAEKGF